MGNRACTLHSRIYLYNGSDIFKKAVEFGGAQYKWSYRLDITPIQQRLVLALQDCQNWNLQNHLYQIHNHKDLLLDHLV